jgi:hypothetical protein
MQVAHCNQLSQAVEKTLRAHVPEETADELFTMTFSYYFFALDGKPLAVLGLMSGGLVVKAVALWLTPLQKTYTREELVAALHFGPQFLRSLPWDIYAEVDPTSKRNNRFVRAFGFKFQGLEHGRQIYKWSA